MDYSPSQQKIISAPIKGSLFLEGHAGSGKSTAAAARLQFMIEAGIPGESILVLVPQRTLAQQYYQVVHSPDLPSGGLVDILTMGGLAQRLISLFWPLVAREAGFVHPNRPPVYLTLETAQYYMAHIVRPLIDDEGYFESVTLDRNRLYSQILDNLNKAAGVGFPHNSLSERLKNAWIGDGSQGRIYDNVQDCANRFRVYCLEHNLLDFSLQLEVFLKFLWPSFLCRAYLTSHYEHLIFDNIEEDVPVVQDVIHQWMPSFKSALLIYDFDGGYRVFLGADPQNGLLLQADCQETITFDHSFVTQPELNSFQRVLASSISKHPFEPSNRLREFIEPIHEQYSTQMVDHVCQEVYSLINSDNVYPGDITILSPFLSDSLRFSLMNRLQELDIPVRSHRPSRSLRDEPATHCLLTLARIAHPSWKNPPSTFDFRQMLVQSVEGMDLIRADLLSKIVHRPRSTEGLGSFDRIHPDTQTRITYVLGERYETLRQWILEYQSGEPTDLDVFLSRLFGEVLSQPGFGFHFNFEAAGVAARLIESVQKFRRVIHTHQDNAVDIGNDYLHMVQEGVVAAQYLQTWFGQPEDAVFVAPAYTFLMANQPSRIQFWLDIGSLGWWERLSQPLTHPYVLSRHWPMDTHWTDINENQTNQENLIRITSGVIRRCRQKIYLCTSGLNENGDEQRGPLLQAVQSILRRFSEQDTNHV